MCDNIKGLHVGQEGQLFHLISVGCFLDLAQKIRSFEQLPNMFCSRNDLYHFMQSEVRMFEATKWFEILFKRPDIFDQVLKHPKNVL